MRVIIDTNSLQTEELRLFLSSRENFAVLPEHTVAEIFKPNVPEAIFAAFSVLCDFPKQVLMLRANRHAALVNPRAAAISNHFVDRPVTREFPNFCNLLREAEAGSAGFRRQLEERRKWAQERAENVQNALGDQSEALAELRANFTAEELRRLGAGEKLSERSRGVILTLTHSVAQDLHVLHTAGRTLHRPPFLYYQFTWRYALCHIVQLMELLRKGAVRRSPAKARNDHFDSVFATFGTYFNGIMTNDHGPMLTQHIARIILKALGARLATDYVESEYILSLLDAQDKSAS